jgi:hypothetical protein
MHRSPVFASTNRSSSKRGPLPLLWLLLLLTGCQDDFCSGGTCTCPEGGHCEFTCEAPPCHVACEGDNGACSGDCANGECSCGPGSNCQFGCLSPPCHVACEGIECEGVCANGECSCAEGSDCVFSCDTGPCHVLCDGDNDRCDGQCQNGACSCGPGSTCSFECLDQNCTFSCAQGAACIARCPAGAPGEQGCAFTTCAAGEVTLCPDGETQACGTSCPPIGDEQDAE